MSAAASSSVSVVPPVSPCVHCATRQQMRALAEQRRKLKLDLKLRGPIDAQYTQLERTLNSHKCVCPPGPAPAAPAATPSAGSSQLPEFASVAVSEDYRKTSAKQFREAAQMLSRELRQVLLREVQQSALHPPTHYVAGQLLLHVDRLLDEYLVLPELEQEARLFPPQVRHSAGQVCLMLQRYKHVADRRLPRADYDCLFKQIGRIIGERHAQAPVSLNFLPQRPKQPNGTADWFWDADVRVPLAHLLRIMASHTRLTALVLATPLEQIELPGRSSSGVTYQAAGMQLAPLAAAFHDSVAALGNRPEDEHLWRHTRTSMAEVMHPGRWGRSSRSRIRLCRVLMEACLLDVSVEISRALRRNFKADALAAATGDPHAHLTHKESTAGNLLGAMYDLGFLSSSLYIDGWYVILLGNLAVKELQPISAYRKLAGIYQWLHARDPKCPEKPAQGTRDAPRTSRLVWHDNMLPQVIAALCTIVINIVSAWRRKHGWPPLSKLSSATVAADGQAKVAAAAAAAAASASASAAAAAADDGSADVSPADLATAAAEAAASAARACHPATAEEDDLGIDDATAETLVYLSSLSLRQAAADTQRTCEEMAKQTDEKQ